MSNWLAIATVTATLQKLLEAGIKDRISSFQTTTFPPDEAGTQNKSKNRLNIFLYQTRPNATWRNMDLPSQVKPGETGNPPVALDLRYLFTAYGKDNDDIQAQQILGLAMRLLHDHAILSRTEIKDALPNNDLHEQIERVRITPDDLSIDDMSKLWNTFQTSYRVSSTYQVSVVLIESAHPAKAPLPVLTRGEEDSGITSQPDLIPPFPTLESVIPPNKQPAVRLGEVLTIRGHHLAGEVITALFTHPRLNVPIEIAPLAGATASELKVQLPDEPANWPIGYYRLSIIVSKANEQERTSNEMVFALATSLLSVNPNPAQRDANGKVTLTVTCKPKVRAGQRAALLLGDREVLAEPLPAGTDQSDTLIFEIAHAPAGEHYVRLRIDGVDSLLVLYGKTPPEFDPTQKVEIQ